MRIIGIIFFACIATHGQPDPTTVTDSGFYGISLNKTTFEEADSILKAGSFKEPNKYFKSIHWRNGESATLLLPRYFIMTGKSEIEVILKGYSTVGVIHISNINSGGDVKYKDIVLGKTRVSDIKTVESKDWEETKDIDGKITLTAKYKGIKIGVDPGSGEKLSDRLITLFVLSTDK